MCLSRHWDGFPLDLGSVMAEINLLNFNVLTRACSLTHSRPRDVREEALEQGRYIIIYNFVFLS